MAAPAGTQGGEGLSGRVGPRTTADHPPSAADTALPPARSEHSATGTEEHCVHVHTEPLSGRLCCTAASWPPCGGSTRASLASICLHLLTTFLLGTCLVWDGFAWLFNNLFNPPMNVSFLKISLCTNCVRWEVILACREHCHLEPEPQRELL